MAEFQVRGRAFMNPSESSAWKYTTASTHGGLLVSLRIGDGPGSDLPRPPVW